MTSDCTYRPGLTRYAVISAIALFAPLQVFAGDRPQSATAESEWTVTAAPYLWATGLDGSVGVLGFPAQPVDLDFADVLESLEGGLMGVVEARRGRFSLGFDLLYANVSDTVSTPVGVAATSFTAEVTTITATAVAGYDLVLDPTFDLDLVGGIGVHLDEEGPVDVDEFLGGALAFEGVEDFAGGRVELHERAVDVEDGVNVVANGDEIGMNRWSCEIDCLAVFAVTGI